MKKSVFTLILLGLILSKPALSHNISYSKLQDNTTQDYTDNKKTEKLKLEISNLEAEIKALLGEIAQNKELIDIKNDAILTIRKIVPASKREKKKNDDLIKDYEKEVKDVSGVIGKIQKKLDKQEEELAKKSAELEKEANKIRKEEAKEQAKVDAKNAKLQAKADAENTKQLAKEQQIKAKQDAVQRKQELAKRKEDEKKLAKYKKEEQKAQNSQAFKSMLEEERKRKEEAQRIKEEEEREAIQNHQPRKVAVFDPTGMPNKDVIDVVREMIQNALIKVKNEKDLSVYAVLEREKIDIVLKENKYQSSGMVNDSQVSELGKQLGADMVCVATVKFVSNEYTVSLRLIEVETAVASESGLFSHINLRAAAQGAINDMLGIDAKRRFSLPF